MRAIYFKLFIIALATVVLSGCGNDVKSVVQLHPNGEILASKALSNHQLELIRDEKGKYFLLSFDGFGRLSDVYETHWEPLTNFVK